MIFNTRNVYANRQHHNPAKIYYNLYNPQEWYPYVNIGVPDEKQIEEEDGSLTETQLREYIEDSWKKEFRPFYNPQDFLQPVTEAQVKRYEEEIEKDVRDGIATLRTGKNLEVKWKPRTEELRTWYEKCIEMAEHEACGRYTPAEADEIKKKLEEKLQELVPERFQYVGIPTFFQFPDAGRIKTLVMDKKREDLTVLLWIF